VGAPPRHAGNGRGLHRAQSVNGDKVDCHWEQYGLTVELITFRYHATRHGFETDNERRRRSRHVPYTYGDIVERAHATVADLRQRLEQAAEAA
jgi:hypothetical protein